MGMHCSSARGAALLEQARSIHLHGMDLRQRK
jgi:hypothetical protein